MNPDEFQRIWQSQAGPALDSEKLAAALRRHDQAFTRMIFLRDVREIGVALVMIPVWIALGVATSSPWTWWLEIPALLWVAGFMYADRRRQQSGAPGPGAPLRAGLEHSVARVEHQIWLLRNILWWYLLPLGLPLVLYVVQVSFNAARQTEAPLWVNIVTGTLSAMVFMAFLVAIYWFIYWLNQYAVRKQLEPMRQQLQQTLDGLTGELPETAA
ncbi:MAG: hypothetical protein JNG89_01260 [Planctomycetaceae bacterium]|nr:hypothetical protein [Planctomycetaceae bacterium]